MRNNDLAPFRRSMYWLHSGCPKSKVHMVTSTLRYPKPAELRILGHPPTLM